MQEHPVPQNVTGYEFHLIGQMTLKQFMEIAGGVVLAVIINTTNLPQIIKYPLMGIVGLLGIALAFLPLEGRPLDRWFFAFIRSIYQPTLFFWKKTDTTPDIFSYTPPANMDTTPQVDYRPMRHSRVQEFLTTIPSQTPSGDEEDVRAQELLTLFSSSVAQEIPIVHTQDVQTQPTTVFSASPPPPPTGRILEMEIESAQTGAPTTPSAPSPSPNEVVAPKIEPFGFSQHPGISSEAKKEKAVPMAGEFTVVAPKASVSASTTTPVQPVHTAKNLPFPSKPTIPNMIVGMVVSADEKILENAIVTIVKADDKTPVRAVKTNALGQFGVVTPLESGSYILEIEKDGYHFDNKSLVLNNQVIDPILITAAGTE